MRYKYKNRIETNIQTELLPLSLLPREDSEQFGLHPLHVDCCGKDSDVFDSQVPLDKESFPNYSSVSIWIGEFLLLSFPA